MQENTEQCGSAERKPKGCVSETFFFFQIIAQAAIFSSHPHDSLVWSLEGIVLNLNSLKVNYSYFTVLNLDVIRINFYFIYCGFFFLILVVFVLFLLSLHFGQISPLAFFKWFTATSDRNAESCNRIPSNYCLP